MRQSFAGQSQQGDFFLHADIYSPIRRFFPTHCLGKPLARHRPGVLRRNSLFLTGACGAPEFGYALQALYRRRATR